MASPAFLIPLIPNPQRLAVQLNGVTYNLRTHWCVPFDGWVLDIYDVNFTLLIGAVALVTGADLLEQYGYLNFNGQLYVYSSEGPVDTVPSFTSLGVTAGLYFVPTAS